MTALDTYLARFFLNEAQLLAAASMDAAELNAMIDSALVPEPSYTVSADGKVTSFVFGEMPAPGAQAGRYFHPSQLVWIARARAAQAHMKEQFTERFCTALAELNASTWRLPDSFADDGTVIAEGLEARTDSAWKYFLKGTFGMCVANPVSEAEIALKEVLQEKLTHLSANGSRTAFSASEAREMAALIDAYAEAAMPFSPVEYPVSSRKRLVEDLRARLHAAQA